MPAALLECLRRMQAAGINRVCVSTGETNTPPRRLYESVGFRIVNRYLDYVKNHPVVRSAGARQRWLFGVEWPISAGQ